MLKTFSLGIASGALIGVLAAALWFNTCGRPNSPSIANRFESYVARIEGRQDLILAKKSVEEKMTREVRSHSAIAKILAALFGPNVGLAEVELRCFVEYNYYVDLDLTKWKFDLSGKSLTVTAPPIQLLKPPGFYTQTVEARIRNRSVFINEKDQLREMKTFLSDTLSVLGEGYLADLQDTCRARLQDILIGFTHELKGEVDRIDSVRFTSE